MRSMFKTDVSLSVRANLDEKILFVKITHRLDP